MELLGYSALALLFTKYFTPIQGPKAWLVDKIVRFIIKIEQFWAMKVVKILTCPKCFSFWFTLAITYNLWSAAITSILTMLIDLIIQYLQDGTLK